MQVKGLLFMGLGLGVIWGAGSYAYNLYQTNNSISSYIEGVEVKYGVDIDYSDIKRVKSEKELYSINDFNLTHVGKNGNIRISAENLIFDKEKLLNGRIDFNNLKIKSRSFSINSSSAYTPGILISDREKEIAMHFLDTDISFKGKLATRSRLKFIYSASANDVSFKADILSGNNESATIDFNGVLAGKEDSFDIDNILNSDIKSLKLNFNGSYFFESLATNFPTIKEKVHLHSLKFIKHHYPKAKRSGNLLANYMQDPAKITISMNPQDDISFKLNQFGDFKHIREIDVLDLFKSLNLEIR